MGLRVYQVTDCYGVFSDEYNFFIGSQEACLAFIAGYAEREDGEDSGIFIRRLESIKIARD